MASAQRTRAKAPRRSCLRSYRTMVEWAISQKSEILDGSLVIGLTEIKFVASYVSGDTKMG